MGFSARRAKPDCIGSSDCLVDCDYKSSEATLVGQTVRVRIALPTYHYNMQFFKVCGFVLAMIVALASAEPERKPTKIYIIILKIILLFENLTYISLSLHSALTAQGTLLIQTNNAQGIFTG